MHYQLAMRRANNNYLLFELSRLEEFKNINTSTLEGIDSLTSQYNNEDEIKAILLENNFIDVEDLESPLVIIFYENEKWRQERYGICFKEHINCITNEFLIEFITQNIDNYEIINHIYNQFNSSKNKTTALELLLQVLKNIKKAKEQGILKNIYAINYLSYKEKRDLGMFIIQNFSDIITLDKVGDGNVKQPRRIIDN